MVQGIPVKSFLQLHSCASVRKGTAAVHSPHSDGLPEDKEIRLGAYLVSETVEMENLKVVPQPLLTPRI
jgi:hypothetical protein